jgi:SAM-dependent methyltransferase
MKKCGLAMKQKIYSTFHLDTALKIFPEKISPQWLEEQWNNEQINECKRHEFLSFISKPDIDTYPSQFLDKESHGREEIDIIIELLQQKKIKKCLTIGCGNGEMEFLLAKLFPSVKFIAQDIAPHIHSLETLREKLGIENLSFRKDLDHELSFDLVFSMSVLYCIPENDHMQFFNYMLTKLSHRGVLLVGCLGVINPIDVGLNLPVIKNIKLFAGKLKRMLSGARATRAKVIGYSYTLSKVIKSLPNNAVLEDINFLYFSRRIRGYVFKKITKLLGISYSGYLLKIYKE